MAKESEVVHDVTAVRRSRPLLFAERSEQLVRFGIIGCGGIARGKHLRELEPVKEARIIVCSDISEDAAKSFAKDCGAEKWYTDYHEMLRRDDIDAVIVSTPHPLHSPIGCDVLAAGKHLLVQKPMATKNEDAKRLLEAEKKSGKVVLALPYMYDHTFVKMQDILQEGIIGQVTMARSRVAHDANGQVVGSPKKRWQKAGRCMIWASTRRGDWSHC